MLGVGPIYREDLHEVIWLAIFTFFTAANGDLVLEDETQEMDRAIWVKFLIQEIVGIWHVTLEEPRSLRFCCLARRKLAHAAEFKLEHCSFKLFSDAPLLRETGLHDSVDID